MSDVQGIQARFAPKFLRGTVTVKDPSITAEYPKSLISASGVYGLRWPPLVPAKHYGKVLRVRVDLIIQNKPFTFEVPALVTREISMRSERMGLKFQFPNKESREKVAAFVEKSGHTPNEYVRKYPRIPSQQFIEAFSIRANAMALPTALNPDPKRIPYRIGNLSPDGLLLLANNEEARNIRPGDTLDIALQGEQKIKTVEIRGKGRVFRCAQEIIDGGEVFNLGVQIFKIDDKNRAEYYELLQMILKNIKATSVPKAPKKT